jgi:hypothetical protein
MLMPELIFRRDDPGYEAARRATMWNARLPNRFPDVIVQATGVDDVVDAVKLAAREQLRIAVCSGGHSWSGHHVRDHGLLLDVSRLNEITIDEESLRATCGPGLLQQDLAAALGRRGLFFPTGHCRGVGLGGFLLQGGFGWHSRVLGPACVSVLGVDVITADGERVHASETENDDLYWAARGSGPGFFGVVTRFELRVYPKPKVSGCALQAFPLRALEPVFRWVHAVGPEIPPSVELNVLIRNKAPGVGGAGIEMFAPVFEDSHEAALQALDFLNNGSLETMTDWHVRFAPTPVGVMSRIVMSHYPAGHRWAVDNMWTHAAIDDLLPGLFRIAVTMPPPPSHMLWLPWARRTKRPDMAFSLEDDIYIAAYGGWTDEKDDDAFAPWAESRMREMQHLASGTQLADENVERRWVRFLGDGNLARLDAIRARRDSTSRFYALDFSRHEQTAA